jgi:hypothetical protein
LHLLLNDVRDAAENLMRALETNFNSSSARRQKSSAVLRFKQISKAKERVNAHLARDGSNGIGPQERAGNGIAEIIADFERRKQLDLRNADDLKKASQDAALPPSSYMVFNLFTPDGPVDKAESEFAKRYPNQIQGQGPIATAANLIRHLSGASSTSKINGADVPLKTSRRARL